MSTKEEREAFAQRLQAALAQPTLKSTFNLEAKAIKGATDLARQFNLKHMGETSVSPQAAYKWLKGQTIPTSDKIKTLAKWLGVGEHWLHYGPLPESEALKMKLMSSFPTLELIEKIEALPGYQRYLIGELVKQLDGDTAH